ncbi:MAG: HAMP domain-containing sensor histidine kinase [Myxococcales bacterium]|nr:HAMP domain-containing sensor histidine kinase [Myxococcales bacterium]
MGSLLGKLLVAVLVPTVATFAGFGFLCHMEAERALAAELGRRLGALAAAAAAQISEEGVALLGPGDESSRTYRNLRRRLLDLREATGVQRVYVFAADHTARVDTDGAVIGERLYTLDSSRAELRLVFGGRTASSMLFRGRDGRLYMSGFAPIQSEPGRAPQFAVGVDGSASLYADLLALRRTLVGVGALGVLAMVVLAVLLGRRLVRPLAQLTQTARHIEQGMLGQPVPEQLRRGRDEVAVLAQGIEEMRRGIAARDERLQMMLSGIAHEVRNPLGGMELFSGLLREELAAEQPSLDAARSYLERIEREIRHLKAVVTEFLEYARRPAPHFSPVELPPLLEEVAECVRGTAPAGTDVVVEAEPVPPCWADITQLRRALLNLTHNAVQACAASHGPHRVTLGCRAGGGAVQISVADTGPGIPEDILPRIWAPFFTTRQQGTGLGLAFVREIVADHGGSITVNTGPGGTVFDLSLPVAPGRPSPAGQG